MESCAKERLLLQNLIAALDVTFETSLSLEQMASVKIIVILWNKKSVREQLVFAAHEFTDSHTSQNSEIWKSVLRRVVKDIHDLNLPKPISRELCEMNNYISKSLLYWLIHTYVTFFNNAECVDPLTWKSYFYTTLNLFWNALCKSNAFEMKFSNDVETCTKFQRPFLALWYNVPKSLENRIHQNAEMIALVLYFLPWSIGQHVIHCTIYEIDDCRKKDVITSKYGRLKCLHFIKHDEWQFYNLYTSAMLSTREELFQYKKFLIDNEGVQVATYFFKSKAIKNGKEYLQFCHKIQNELSNTDFFISYFMKHGHWDLLDIYMYLFCNQDEIYELKKSLLKEKGFLFFELLVEKTGWSVQKDFLRWFFKIENQFGENKDLLFSYFLQKFRDGPATEDFSLLIHFLKWSADESCALSLEDDNMIFLANAISLKFTELNLQKIDNFLNTAFGTDDDRVKKFKERIIASGKPECINLIYDLIKKNPATKSWQIFTNWCFSNVEIRNFKSFLLKSDLWSKLLRQFNLDLANDFVAWCCDWSHEKVIEFKSDILVSKKVEVILDECLHSETELRKLARWFGPTRTLGDVDFSWSRDKYKHFHELLTHFSENFAHDFVDNV